MTLSNVTYSYKENIFAEYIGCISLNPLLFSQKNTFFFLGSKNKFIQSSCPR